MEEKFELTKTDIQRIFECWDMDYLNNPEEFQPIREDNKCWESQADEFIRLYKLINTKIILG